MTADDGPPRRIRPPAAAGSFYPGDPTALAAAVDALLAGAETPGPDEPAPLALIVPHAGYVYSGPIAAIAYVGLGTLAETVERVAVLGPAHFAPLDGFAVPAAEAWATPLGDVPVDPRLRHAATAGGAFVDDEPFVPEHAHEVQLPFLQRLLPADTPVLPVAVGRCAPGAAASLIGLLREAGAFVLVSTDLSHYLDHGTAQRLDRQTADAVVARHPAAIGDLDACGVTALRGVVEHARLAGLTIRLLDLRTSADTAGEPDRVVGYGAFSIAAS